jgi:ABC-type sugar transport system ATPase subunit
LVLRALRSINVPTLYVTHDPLEAFLLADEIAVLKDGRLEGPERNRMREWAEESFGKFASLYAEMLGSE